MSLENSPNSSAEFGEFSKLRFRFFFLSLENSPNSRVEFGEFSKLKGWVWRKSPNSGSKSPNSFFSKKNRNLKNTHTQRLSLENLLSLDNSPNSDSKDFFFWVWRTLQTQELSLENSPNSRVEFGENLQTQVQNLQIHFFLQNNELKKLQNSEVEFGEFSKLRFKRIFFLTLENSPNSRVEFGEFSKFRFKISKLIRFSKKSKLRGWVWRILQTQWLRILQTQAFFKNTRNPKP